MGCTVFHEKLIFNMNEQEYEAIEKNSLPAYVIGYFKYLVLHFGVPNAVAKRVLCSFERKRKRNKLLVGYAYYST